MVVPPPQQQLEYTSLIPNYSAPSSVCTSDSGGGSRLRTIRLHRRLSNHNLGRPTFGFSVRGGREHGTGFFVSAVEPGSEAHSQNLRIGDQIVRINGLSLADAIHREVLQYIQGQNYLEMRVRTVGMIPVKDKRTDPLTWQIVEDDRLHSPPVHNENNEDVIRDVRLFLNIAPHAKLGCGICKGPEWKAGIFVQFVKENGLACEAGLRPGDQILQCNGVQFVDMPFGEAVNVLKSSRQLDLIIRKGAGLELFPGESSGYNSSASSVNGDQSPNWGDTKRLSIVKEETIELEDRLEQLEKTESKQRKKDSPVLRVHFEDSELSLNSRSGQQIEAKHKENGKLAEICMVSQQLETKTVVVEVHRSEETDDSSVASQRVSSDEVRDKTMKSQLSEILITEISGTIRRENGDYREVERKKDILKVVDKEKHQQHEQMPNETKNSWKPPQTSSGKNSPPSCPTPDYDTSSSSAPSPTASLITVNVHSSPHRGNISQNHNSPVYATVNKAAKSVLNPATNGTKTVSTSQNVPKNNDSVEMQSIESFTLNHPNEQRPKPPDTYFVPVRKKNGKRVPTRFDFLPSHGSTVVSTSETDGSNINCQLQSELTQTLLRSNLRKQTKEPTQNGLSSAKGMVTISVNNQAPVEEPRSHANKIHIESNNNSRSKVSIVTSEYRNQVPSGIKPAIKNTADKLVKSMGTVTIKVPNGAESNH
ncbi:hypothetical protein C0J52_18709 [Blattella germanica]|nr:hypothetical protein C0J52_18709 [Blattella germanica]